MLCCAGLFGGFILGAATGIPWMPYVASSLGAGAGIIGDIKLFKTLDERKVKDLTANQAVVTCCSSIKKKNIKLTI
jgi:uncharacterized membrane protein